MHMSGNQTYTYPQMQNNNFVDTNPASNRFGNNTMTVSPSTYYASGVPAADFNDVSKIGSSSNTPHNGNLVYAPESSLQSNYNGYPGYPSYPGYPNQPGRPNQRTSTYYPQTNCAGSSYQNSYAPNSLACQQKCIADRNCKSWTHNNANNQCHLKQNENPCRKSQNYTSGTINYGVPPTPYPSPTKGRSSSVLPMVILPGNYAQTNYAPNSNTCKNVCLKNNDCNKWTYNTDTNICKLGYGQPNMAYNNRNATSGEIYRGR